MKKSLENIGLHLSKGVKDTLGNRWAYCISPIESGGATQYYSTVGEVKDALKRIREHRNFLSNCREV